jgi:hypothetical protein
MSRQVICSAGAALLLIMLTPPADASAQVVRGRVIDADADQPLPGALVLLLAGQERIASYVSPASGGFILDARAPGTYTIRAELIGFESSVAGPFALVIGDTLVMELRVATKAITLPAITAEATRRCVRRPEEGAATAALWEEARKALEVTQILEARRGLRMTAVEYRRRLDPDGTEVLEEISRRSRSYSGPPFAARPAGELVEEGFAVREAGEILLLGPTAEVLLSDAFLDAHCFRLRPPGQAESGLLGLQFEPLPDRRQIGIEGTLWLDQRTAELRYAEYTYTNHNFPGPRQSYSGRITFSRLPTGAWYVDRWHIRSPIVERRHIPTATGATQVWESTAALLEFGGEVSRVTSSDSAPVAELRRAIAGTVSTGADGTPLEGARVFVPGTAFHAVSDADGSFRIDDLLPGRYSVQFTHPRLDSIGATPIPAVAVVGAESGVVMVHLTARQNAPARAVVAPPSRPVRVRGAITDVDTGERIAAAEVRLYRPGNAQPLIRVYADSLFDLELPGTGEYEIEATVLGYRPSRRGSFSATAAGGPFIRFRLSRQVIDLEPLIVEARAQSVVPGLSQRQATGFGRFMTRDHLDGRPDESLAALLTGPLRITQAGPGTHSIEMTRAAAGRMGPCVPIVFLDGVVWYRGQQGERDALGDVLRLRSSDIEALEIYQGAADVPGEYRIPGSNCGVIAVWTRRE